MKIKSAFSLLVFFVSVQFYGQDNLSLERHDNKIVSRFSKPKKKSPERLPDIKNNTLFCKKNEVVRLSSINGNFAHNAREIFSRIQ
jgi:hypothetical protein